MSHNSSARDEPAATLAAGSHMCLRLASYDKKHFVQKGKSVVNHKHHRNNHSVSKDPGMRQPQRYMLR